MEPKSLPPRRLNKSCPRKNLPSALNKKRGESNFTVAFARAYTEEISRRHNLKDLFCIREVPVTGFGIADFMCVAPRKPIVRTDLPDRTLTDLRVIVRSFEMKLTGWQRGFAQACRYRFFSHSVFLVLPPSEANLAKKQMELFRQTGVGLISFEVDTRKIKRLFSPKDSEPRSARAYEHALGKLSISSCFRRFAENR
jgi:hypothetical protein